MTPSTPVLRIGTRGSPLALAQAHETAARLRAAHADLAAGNAIEIVVIKTTGDQIQDRPLAEIGGKGLFTKEIDEAQLDGRIDIAVHSMKDVPTWLPDGLVLPCMLPREDPRDAFISLRTDGLDGLPAGAVVGSASLRRQAQILARRPDLRVEVLRGNVQTRLDKLRSGVVDATLLAMAGLNRLGRPEVATAVLDPETMLPAVGQGAIGITCRADDAAVRARLAPLNDADTLVRVTAERAMLAVLDGSCRTPIAGHAELAGERLVLSGLVARPDGSAVHRDRRAGAAAAAEDLGRAVGESLLARAGPGFLAAGG